MNDQDRDLIAALAEGRLGTDAAEAAIARIESDPELSTEYASQVTALEFLASSATPRMTSTERTTLHANLTEQLGLVAAPAPETVKKKTPWWAPAFGLATAAAVVAAVVILPGGLSDQSADMSAESAGEALMSVTTAAAGSTAEAPTSAEENQATDGGQADDAVPEAGGISVYETDAVQLEELLSEIEGADSTDEIQRELSDLSLKSTIDLDAAEINACIDDLSDQIPPGVEVIHVIGALVEAEATIIHLGFDYGEGVEDGLSFEFENCSLVRHADQG